MKKLIKILVLAALVTAGTTVMAQEYPDEYMGLPGDNLNLYAVMKLFQESQTLEGFERSLNDVNSRINNLDLNGDNLVDYITVNDYIDGNVHTIVLRTALNNFERQDVAVFTVQRFSNGSVQVQLVGDEELYGRNYIIEPIYDDYYSETPNPGYAGSSSGITLVRTTYYEVAAWPVIRFIYLPDYVVWRSSWYWGYYPSYWHPWCPFYWHFYYGYHYHWHNHYYAHYRHWHHHRYTRYNDFYYSGIRSHSATVSVRIKEGSYRTTYTHPEQRREGEALYSRMYSGHNTGKPGYSANHNHGRSTMPHSTRGQTSGRTSSDDSRKSSTSVKSKPGKSHYEGQDADVSPKSFASTGNKHRSDSSPDKKPNVSRRSSSGISAIHSFKPEKALKEKTARSSGSSASRTISTFRMKSDEDKSIKDRLKNDNKKDPGITGIANRR